MVLPGRAYLPRLCVNFAGTVVVEATDPVEVDYIVEAGHIVDIAVMMDIVDLVLLAVRDSSVLCK